MFPEHLKYTADHAWLRDDGDLFVVGITDHAAELVGDVSYVELPQVGMTVRQGEEIAVVESVKASSDVYAPVGGRIVAVNEELEAHPEWVNEDPYEKGWFFKLQGVNTAETDCLMTADAYWRSTAENV